MKPYGSAEQPPSLVVSANPGRREDNTRFRTSTSVFGVCVKRQMLDAAGRAWPHFTVSSHPFRRIPMTATRLLTFLVAVVALAPAPEAHAVYDVGTGRWLTRDPAGYVDGPNTYGYCLNNPLAASDSAGLACADKLQEVINKPAIEYITEQIPPLRRSQEADQVLQGD
jgi:hypothetical protein